MSPPSSAAAYSSTALVTIAYLSVYYLLLLRQLRAKRHARARCEASGQPFDRYNTHDRRFLAAERSSLNLLEHMPPFLCLLWLHAWFASPLSASIAGAAYTATRIAYPFLLGQEMPLRLPYRLLVATYSSYAIQVYLALGVVQA